MTTRALDPVLARQLKRLGLDPTGAPPSPEAWVQLVGQINDHYVHLNDDRALLNRSLELSTLEQEQLRARVEVQRDRLSAIIGTIGDALSKFGQLAHASSDRTSGTPNALAAARGELEQRLQEILADSRLREHSSDVSAIRTNLVRLADQLLVLLADTAERVAIKKELEVARVVQQMLVPADQMIERGRLQIVGYFQPAAECGGDWWTVADLAGGKVLTAIGDVTGHGIAAAIMTGVAKAACELAIEVTTGKLDGNELLAMMSSTLFRTAQRQVMMTCSAAIIDPQTGQLSLANAGHPNPILIRRGIVHPLMAEGAPLGATPDATYKQVQLACEPGDVLLCFTDGVVECENHRGEQFTERRLRAVVQRAAGGGALAVRNAVAETLAGFRNDVPQTDDLTFVVTRFG